MRLADVAMVAADTSRSRVYIQALARNSLLPNFVLVLGGKVGQPLPGQADPSHIVHRAMGSADACWSEADFDSAEPLQVTLKHSGTPFEVASSPDINDEAVVAALKHRIEPTFIYSGYGGALLRAALHSGKRFLHVHGGYLPDFKGSTTNYFSLLVDNTLGASALFLTEDIDGGPVLCRRRFPPPLDRTQMEHTYDAAARAKVLVGTLHAYVRTGEWREELPVNSVGETYFIIHPVLKHIAILSDQQPSR